MSGRLLSDKEKEELKRLLEDQNRPPDTSWLMTEEYAKKTKKQNPYNLGCILCAKTHTPINCPNRKEKKEESYTYSYYNHDSSEDY